MNNVKNYNRKAPNLLNSLVILISFLCLCHSYAIRMPFVCHSYVKPMYSYATCMSSCICHSNVLVCHSYVTHMCSYIICVYSYVICMSLVCIRMSSACHSHILVCHPYVTRMWFYHEPLLRSCKCCQLIYTILFWFRWNYQTIFN